MDWNRIRRDYIAGKGSYRDLASRYGVPLKTLSRRARDEGWPELRKQAGDKATTKTVEAVAQAGSRIDTRIYQAADRLLGMLEKSMDELDAAVITKRFKVKTETQEITTEYKGIDREKQAPIDRAGLRQLTQALSELKDIMDVRSAMDQEEQRARIEKLRTSKEDTDTGVTVQLEGVCADYAE